MKKRTSTFPQNVLNILILSEPFLVESLTYIIHTHKSSNHRHKSLTEMTLQKYKYIPKHVERHAAVKKCEQTCLRAHFVCNRNMNRAVVQNGSDIFPRGYDSVFWPYQDDRQGGVEHLGFLSTGEMFFRYFALSCSVRDVDAQPQRARNGWRFERVCTQPAECEDDESEFPDGRVVS